MPGSISSGFGLPSIRVSQLLWIVLSYVLAWLVGPRLCPDPTKATHWITLVVIQKVYRILSTMGIIGINGWSVRNPSELWMRRKQTQVTQADDFSEKSDISAAISDGSTSSPKPSAAMAARCAVERPECSNCFKRAVANRLELLSAPAAGADCLTAMNCCCQIW